MCSCPPSQWIPGVTLKLSGSAVSTVPAESFCQPCFVFWKHGQQQQSLSETFCLCAGHVKPWFKWGLWTEEAKRTVPQESPGGWLGRSDESTERRGSTEGEFGRILIHMTLKFLFNPDMQWLCVCEETEEPVKAELPSGYRYLVDKRMTQREAVCSDCLECAWNRSNARCLRETAL